MKSSLVSQNEMGGKTWSPNNINKLNEIHIKGSKVPKKRVFQDPPTSLSTLSVLSDTELASTSSESRFTNTNSQMPLLIARCGLESSSSNAQISLQDLISSQKTNGDPGLKDPFNTLSSNFVTTHAEANNSPSETTRLTTSGPTLGDLVSGHQQSFNPSKITSNDTSGPTLGDLVSGHQQSFNPSKIISNDTSGPTLGDLVSGHQQSFNPSKITSNDTSGPTLGDLVSGHQQSFNPSKITSNDTSGPTLGDLVSRHQQSFNPSKITSNDTSGPTLGDLVSGPTLGDLVSQQSFNPSKITSNDTSGPTLGDLVSRHQQSFNPSKITSNDTSGPTLGDLVSGHQQSFNPSKITSNDTSGPTLGDLVSGHQQSFNPSKTTSNDTSGPTLGYLVSRHQQSFNPSKITSNDTSGPTLGDLVSGHQQSFNPSKITSNDTSGPTLGYLVSRHQQSFNPSKITSNDTSGPTLGDLVSRHKNLQHISISPKPQATGSLALPDILQSQKSYNSINMSDVTSGHEQELNSTQFLNIPTCTKPNATTPTLDDLIGIHQQGSSGLSTRSMLTKPTGISSSLVSINHNGTSSSQKCNSLTTNAPMATRHLTLSDLVLQHQYSPQTSISRTDSSLFQSGTESLSQLAKMMDTSLSIHNEPHSSDTIVISSQSSPSMVGLVLSDKSHKRITTSNEMRRRKQRVLRRLDKLYFTGSRFNFVTPSPDDLVIKHQKQHFKN